MWVITKRILWRWMHLGADNNWVLPNNMVDLHNNDFHYYCLPNSVCVLVVMPEIDKHVHTRDTVHSVDVGAVEIVSSSVEEDGGGGHCGGCVEWMRLNDNIHQA